jgi:hypothetical protein
LTLDQINICGCNIKILAVENLYRDYYNRYAEWSPFDEMIKYDSSLKGDIKWVFITHEVIEAICDLNLISLKEHEKQTFAVAFHDIIKNERLPIYNMKEE